MSETPENAAGGRPTGIFVIVNNTRVGPFQKDEVTGAEIKRKGGFAPNYELFRITEKGLVPVRNNDEIRIHEGEKFECIPPSPASSW